MNIGDVMVLIVAGTFAVGAFALARSADEKQRGTDEERKRLIEAEREAKKYGQL